jgi:MoaA/NifB/PqqE/SkfB family radical SAM enzyme
MAKGKSIASKLNFGFAKRYIGESVFKQILNYLEGDPEANIPRLIKIFQKITPIEHHKKLAGNLLKMYQENPSIRKYFNSIFQEIDRGVRDRLVCNFVINTLLLSPSRRKQVEEKTGIHVPITLLIDPTSACNLKCPGCWAGEYAKHDQLEPELLNRILDEAKELGIFGVVMSGGEPFLYPYLLDMAEKHDEQAFMIYTNGTKIDDQVAARLQKVGNISPCVSIEGWQEKTDERRGKGTYDKVVAAMERMHERGVLFGASITVTRNNYKEVTSDEFIDFLTDKGVRYMWAFHYIPVGRTPNTDLMVLPEQRAYLYQRASYLRENKIMTYVDFWNDGELTNGCIAGGDSFFHINPRGDVEPCVFVHFAVDNIRDKSLKEVLGSPFFREYQRRQPFSDNYLRPCPIIDMPDQLRQMIKNNNARPTHEGADNLLTEELSSFLDQRAADWGKTADEIWESKKKAKKRA